MAGLADRKGLFSRIVRSDSSFCPKIHGSPSAGGFYETGRCSRGPAPRGATRLPLAGPRLTAGRAATCRPWARVTSVTAGPPLRGARSVSGARPAAGVSVRVRLRRDVEANGNGGGKRPRSSFVAGERTSVLEEPLLRAPAVHEGGLPGSPSRRAPLPAGRRAEARSPLPPSRSLPSAAAGSPSSRRRRPPSRLSGSARRAPPYRRQQWYGRLPGEGPEGGRAWPCRRRGKMAAGGREDATGTADAGLWLGLRDAAQRCRRWAAEAIRRVSVEPL